MTEELQSHILYRIGQDIWKVVPPIFLIFGTLGNILSIVILTRKRIRKSSTSVYLKALAISDLLFLYSWLPVEWLSVMFQTELSTVLCKVTSFSVFFFATLSAWILVALTYERVLLVWHPHSGKAVCCRKPAGIIITTITLTLMAIYSHLLFGLRDKIMESEDTTFGNNYTTERCSIIEDENYRYFFHTVWPWIDLTFYTIGPFLLLLVGNSLIIARILYSRRKVQSRVLPLQNGQNTKQKKITSLTSLLFALSAVYLLTSMPISIYIINFNEWTNPKDIEGMATASLVWSICKILSFANNTFNFVLYFISGKKFREEAYLLLCCKKSTVAPQ